MVDGSTDEVKQTLIGVAAVLLLYLAAAAGSSSSEPAGVLPQAGKLRMRGEITEATLG